MKILSNLNDSNHCVAFFDLCKEADEIVMASPFCYPDFMDFAKSIKSVGSVRKIVFITTAKNDEIVSKIDALLSFHKEMERIGVQWELRVDNILHGKIYVFKRAGQPFAGIITSANLTHNGMIANHEWGVQIDDMQVLMDLENKIVKNAPDILTCEQLDKIKKRVLIKYPSGFQKPKSFIVAIDDIVHTCSVAKDTRIFVKPIGVSGEPSPTGNLSVQTDMYFSKKYPRAVRIGDILIPYAVGGRKIIGIYKVTSNPIKKENANPRWPWYVTSECLTPNLSNCKWEIVGPLVTQIANKYVNDFDQPITYTGGKTLGALNRGSDKIQLDYDYARYLYGVLLSLENNLTVDSSKG